MLKQSINLVPVRRDLYQAKLVFYLFIASLSMFFLASIITYCLVRAEAFQSIQRTYDSTTNTMVANTRIYESLRLPVSFWTSTLMLVLISVFLQRAVWFVRRENQTKLRSCLIWAWAIAVGFLVVQTFGMSELFTHHFSQTDGSTKVYGMSFTLAFLHALHVLGGMFFLAYVIYQSFRNRYDHERHWPVDHCAGYWHFLDLVWVSMLIVFAVTK